MVPDLITCRRLSPDNSRMLPAISGGRESGGLVFAPDTPLVRVGVTTLEMWVHASFLPHTFVTRLDSMLAPTFHHLSESIAYLTDLINLPAGYCIGLIGLLMTLGLALAVGLARRRRTA